MADTPSTGNATPNQATPNDAETAQSTEETVQLAVAAAVEIASPGRGAEASVTVEAGRTYTLVDPVLRFTQDGGDLVVHWRDGGHTTLEDYLVFAQTDLPPALTLADGTVILFNQLVASIEGFNLGAIAPAAAAAAAQAAGGAYNTPFDNGTLGPEHGIKALLLGTELQFGLIEGLDELPPDVEAVNAPPLADDVLTPADRGEGGENIPTALSSALSQVFASGTIDFDTLLTVSSSFILVAEPFTEDGFVFITSPLAPGDDPSTAFFTVGKTNSFFTSSAALGVNFDGDTVTLTASGGGFFDLQSIDLAEASAGAPSVTFTGEVFGGGTVTQTFTLDGAAGAETFFFSSDFDDVVSVSWDQGTSTQHQFDNIVIDSVEPADVAFFKELTVDGIIGDSDLVVADFGGADDLTSLENLVFTLTSDPNYGFLIKITSGGDVSFLTIGDTFTSTDTMFWVATQDQVDAFLTANELEVLPDATFTYSVTDADGATADATVTITKNVPTVTSNATVLLDDDALSGGNPGGTGDDADAANTSGTLGFSFGADGAGSIAYLTSGPPTDFSYVLSGSSLLVKQGTTTVLTITLNTTTGAYTVTQNATIDHVAGSDENNQVFTIKYLVTDSDGDTVEGTLTVNVDDDTPVAGTPQTTILANSLSNSATADLDFSIGADAPGTFDLTKALATDGSQATLGDGNDVFGFVPAGGTTVVQLTSDGTNLVWHENDGTGTLPDGSWSAVLTGTTGDQAAFEAATVFTVSVNSDGTYTVTLDDTLQLDGAFTTFTVDLGVSGGNNIQLFIFDSTAADVNTEGTTNGISDGIPDGSTIMVLATAEKSDGTPGTVNSSNQGMGVSQGAKINVNDVSGTNISEKLSLFFGEPVDPALIGSDNEADSDFVSSPLILVKITFDSLDGGDFAIVAVFVLDDPDTAGDQSRTIFFKVAGLGSGSAAASDEVLTIQQGTDGSGNLGGDGSEATPFVVDMTGGTGTTFVDGDFFHLDFTSDVSTDSSYRVQSVEGIDTTTGFDIDTTFTAKATDGDGDSVTDTFDVTFDARDVMEGTSGDDVIVGDGGAQTLIGGGGDDILTGSTGDDVFKYTDATNDGDDTILDFVNADGDEVDLDALFDALGAGTADARAALVDITGNVLTIDGNSGTGGNQPIADFSITFAGTSDTFTDQFGFTDAQLQALGIDVGS